MSKSKIFIAILVVVLILIQFYPADKPEVKTDNPGDLLKTEQVPVKVAEILKNACYDCHSNEPNFPWYASIAPVKWWVYDHIEEGREELNFSEWASLDKGDKAEKLDDIGSEVDEGEMPLKPYPLTHPEARLSDEDKQLIIDWAESYAEDLFD